jgi:two-component system sensor histidine kinase UhpB
MSLQRNLVVSVSTVLLISLLAGALLTYEHAVTKVRTEMRAALIVGRRVVQNAIDSATPHSDPSLLVARIIQDFNGDRHLRAVLADPAGKVLMRSDLQPPPDPAPAFFFNFVGGSRLTTHIDLSPALTIASRLVLETDSSNEVSEAWDDVKLDLTTLFLFFCLVLALITYTLRGAFRPLEELCSALARVGSGDYGTRLSWPNADELNEVESGFNLMADRLAEMAVQNRLLQARVECIQEDERGEMARDLHDEVAPFLFAVSADASLILQHVSRADLNEIEQRANGILLSVSHMQLHLRDVLSRLMPDVLLDLGLSGAIESLVHFWQSRRPDIEFSLSVAPDPLDDRSSAVIFRVVQESLSNAVRHAHPSKIDISLKHCGECCEIDIVDNGTGLKPGYHARGFGLLGMRERVAAIGGKLSVASRIGEAGVAVHAVLPCPAAALVVS